jgi:hypothetical protein
LLYTPLKLIKIKWINMKKFSITILTLTLTIIIPLNKLLFTKTALAQSAKEFSVEISKRKVIGEKKIRVFQGDKLTILWQTDENVEVHLHGYNIKKEVVTNKVTTMVINTRATGRFPVTSHGFSGEKAHTHGKNALLYIEVHPK